jgi:hypothetical protein
MRPLCALSVLAVAVAAVGQACANPVFPPSFGWWKSLFRKDPKPTVRSTSPPALPSCPFALVVEEQREDWRLVVPRKLLKDLKLAELSIATPPSGKFADSRHTLLAGVFLALALSCGGLWLVRRGVSRPRVLVVGAILLLAIGGTAWADLPPFGGPRLHEVQARILAQQRAGQQIMVEVVEEGDAIKLLAGRERLAKMIEQTPPKAHP